MDFNGSNPYPEGVISLLDTDLYKLIMQCAVLKHFPEVQVTYSYKNRTPDKKISRAAFNWLYTQIMKLGNISLTHDELDFLRSFVTVLNEPYLNFLKELRLNPREQVLCSFTPDDDKNDSDNAMGTIDMSVKGLWVETILYEIPLLALTSEAYFRFVDINWNYDGQEEAAYEKGTHLLRAGCVFTEFGTRRRRDYHTQALVLGGLIKAQNEGIVSGLPGRFLGTSNPHLAMRFCILPRGTIAHEWFMGVAAITDDYETATAKALSYWTECFKKDELGYVLTDTFGTPAFLKAFSQPPPGLNDSKIFAESFSGVRQDSGDPIRFVRLMKEYYQRENIKEKKTIMFSDSLDLYSCRLYQHKAIEAGFNCEFGIGTYFTNDFIDQKTGGKSTPLNIVIKLSSAGGKPAVKLSDIAAKSMGDQATVEKVKNILGYTDVEWSLGDESQRWGA